ncbi:MAG: hypothetical protein AAB639_02600 [Patescibacteria group bacterium]
METVESLGGIVTGFWFYHLFSQPLKLQDRLPKIKIKTLEVLPNLKIRLTKRTIHIHHWVSLSIAFAILITATTGFTQFLLVKSFCLGGIIQGFTYSDRFKIITKHSQ